MIADRVAAAAGAAFVVLAILSSLIADVPSADASAGTVAAYFDDDHASVVTAVYLIGLSLACFLVFLGGLAAQLRAAGRPGIAAAPIAAGIALVAVLAQADVVLAALAFRATDDASLAQSMFDLVLLAPGVAAFPAATLVAATALAALLNGLWPGSYAWAALAIAAALLVAGATFAGDGFFAPSGGYSRVAYAVFYAWVLVTSSLMLSRARARAAV